MLVLVRVANANFTSIYIHINYSSVLGQSLVHDRRSHGSSLTQVNGFFHIRFIHTVDTVGYATQLTVSLSLRTIDELVTNVALTENDQKVSS